MARYGWRKYLRGSDWQDAAADDTEYDDDVPIPYLYIWRDGIPSRGRLGCDFPLGGTHGNGSRGIRHIHVFAPASREDVYECMLSVGGTQFLDGGNSLPCDGDGPGIEVIGMAIPSEALFRDLPDGCV